MDVCFLCLGSVGSLDNTIYFNSEKWKQQNIKDLIDTHLWPMEDINPSSWICIECGGVLCDFHKYYKRIERVQQNHIAVLNTKEIVLQVDHKCIPNKESSENVEDCKDNFFKTNLLPESDFEPHINMKPPLPTEFIIDGPYIKSESEDDSKGDEIKLQLTRKRGRPAKGLLNTTQHREDPLMKTKNCKISNKRKTTKLLVSSECNAITENKPAFESDMEPSFKTPTETKESNNSETDKKESVYKDTSTEILKKKNHRNIDEKTLKEYDKIIAENFKLFCNICQIEVDNFLSLRRHFKVEHKQRGYARCCKRNFFTRSLLVDHIHVHLNREYFKCYQCSKVFSDRSRLLCHKKLHEDDSKLEKCDMCGKLFADKGALKKHVLTHSSEKLYPCTICGKFFTNSFILNHHIEAVHQNKFVQICDICGKSIRCPTAFASHMEKHEVKTTPISCDVCGLLLTNKEGLKRHKNSQHPEGGKKEHTCHICSKVSPTLRALKSHIRSVHEQGFDFKCSLCEKSFKRPAVLREHMATHTGTALYTCLWCPRTFISNGNMYNHRKNAHPKEWEELKRQKYAGNAL